MPTRDNDQAVAAQLNAIARKGDPVIADELAQMHRDSARSMQQVQATNAQGVVATQAKMDVLRT